MTKSDKIEKYIWTIAEVAEMLNVSAPLIRRWEREFTWIRPRRNKIGDIREYRISDIRKLKEIQYLLHTIGVTYLGIKRAKEMNYFGQLIDIVHVYA